MNKRTIIQNNSNIESGIYVTSNFTFPESSDWQCKFSNMVWIPEKDKLPNAWVRFWTKVFFGCQWKRLNK